jgi:hypothetical protein
MLIYQRVTAQCVVLIVAVTLMDSTCSDSISGLNQKVIHTCKCSGYMLAEMEKHMRTTAGELLLNFYRNISNDMVHLSAEYFTNEAWGMIPRGKFK